MNLELAALFIVLFFAYLQFFITSIPIWLIYLVIFGVPVIRLIIKKDYHIFSFDLTDTMQSLTLNSVFGIGFVIILIIIGFMIGRSSIVAFSSPGLIGGFFGILISLFQELFFRYYLQETFELLLKNTNNSIILASIVSASFFVPKWEVMIGFFIMGLFLGWVYSRTRDIYGITVAHFIISLFLDFTM
jgi:membrane protease YdiL (CAAX protease family)